MKIAKKLGMFAKENVNKLAILAITTVGAVSAHAQVTGGVAGSTGLTMWVRSVRLSCLPWLFCAPWQALEPLGMLASYW